MGFPGSVRLDVNFSNSCNCRCKPSSKEASSDARVVYRRGSGFIPTGNTIFSGTEKQRIKENEETRQAIKQAALQILQSHGLKEIVPLPESSQKYTRVRDVRRLSAYVAGVSSVAELSAHRPSSQLEGETIPSPFRRRLSFEELPHTPLLAHLKRRTSEKNQVVGRNGKLHVISSRFFSLRKEGDEVEALQILQEKIDQTIREFGLGEDRKFILDEGERVTVAKVNEVDAWIQGVHMGKKARSDSLVSLDGSLGR